MNIAQFATLASCGLASALVFGILGAAFGWLVQVVRSKLEVGPRFPRTRIWTAGVCGAVLGGLFGTAAGTAHSPISVITAFALFVLLLMFLATLLAGFAYASDRFTSSHVGIVFALGVNAWFLALPIYRRIYAHWNVVTPSLSMFDNLFAWAIALFLSSLLLAIAIGSFWLVQRAVRSAFSMDYRKAVGMIETPRLRLIPATLAIARAELRDRTEFARLLGAVVPADWPPESTADALPLFLQWMETTPNSEGWFGWYAVRHGDGADVLVGSIGFLGPPKDGHVEMGYSVLPEYQRKGIATEMAHAIVDWAWQRGVIRIVAETDDWNEASIKVLRNVGFDLVGPGSEPGRLKFERAASTSASTAITTLPSK